jgi:hypothetical protein
MGFGDDARTSERTMKPFLPMLFAACLVSGAVAHAQADAGPAAAPETVVVRGDGHCTRVRPGDTVNFSLTIDGVLNAKAVFASLQLTTGHAVYREADLPMPGSGVLGGGGAGTRDSATDKVYHFAFKVPSDVLRGVYRSAGVAVTADFGGGPDKAVMADVDRHAREQVRKYCLVVFGPAENEPVVTDFQPGTVEHK